MRKVLPASQIPVLLAAFLPSCDSPTDVERGLCPQTYEFGNHGCAVVEGVVTDGEGDPVRGMIVGPAGALRSCCDAPYVDSDEDGRYRFVVHWYAPVDGGAAPTKLEDAWVLAQTPPLGAVDSVRTTLQFAPVGERAPVNVVDLPLDVVF